MFEFNLYTPSGIVIKDLKCSEVLLPAVKGQINILEGHTHTVSNLETGVIVVKTKSGNRTFSLASGLVKVLGDKITVLSSTSEKAEVIDLERAKSAKAKAESRLSSLELLTDLDRIKFERKLKRANIRIKLAELNK